MGVDPADDRCLKLLARVCTFAGKGGGKWEWRPGKVGAREVGGKWERSVLRALSFVPHFLSKEDRNEYLK